MASGSAAMNDFVVNELLCALKCHYGKASREHIMTTFVDFYCEKEIIEAKKPPWT